VKHKKDATMMQLAEQHIIRRNDPRWMQIDAACFLSKNLYNAANYIVRQAYIFQQHITGYGELHTRMKQQSDYCALPRKVSQWVLKQVIQDWTSYLAAIVEWQVHPDRFASEPHMPHYKDKCNGRNLLVYTSQAVSMSAFKKKGQIQPSQLNITIQTQQKTFNQVRIVPHKTHYVVEVVHSVKLPQDSLVDKDRVAAIDIGVDNLATVTSNQPDFTPLLVNGRPLKSLNQGYNKERARLQAQLPQHQYSSKKLDALTDNRNRRVVAYLHVASRRIIDMLVAQCMGTLVIGKNDGWKQKVKLGKHTNQTFVNIPHAVFIKLLTYKAQLAGIQVILTEESYTSKCSFLDNEPICKHESYAGKRVKRGLFRASNGRLINADVNGSLNIMRKVLPNAVSNGIAASVVTPVQVTYSLHKRLP
jgi:putative transposase